MHDVSRTADVEARPGPIAVDPRATAIVVDMQNDFAAPGGDVRPGRSSPIGGDPGDRRVDPPGYSTRVALPACLPCFLKMQFATRISWDGPRAAQTSPNTDQARPAAHRTRTIADAQADRDRSRSSSRDTWNTEIVGGTGAGARQTSSYPKAPLQRLLRNRSRRDASAAARHRHPHLHGSDHERVRGVDAAGRTIYRDYRCLAVKRLHGRADRRSGSRAAPTTRRACS